MTGGIEKSTNPPPQLKKMPRPKPPSPLKARYVRMSDEEWEKFKQMGGADWLRRIMKTRPARYYEVFKQPKELND